MTTTTTAIGAEPPDPFAEVVRAGYTLPCPLGHEQTDYSLHIAGYAASFGASR